MSLKFTSGSWSWTCEICLVSLTDPLIANLATAFENHVKTHRSDLHYQLSPPFPRDFVPVCDFINVT